MQTTFKALLIAIYAAAIVSLFGVLPSDLGHLLQRLPLGNTGRATVSALRPMQPPPQVQRLVNAALGWAA